VANLAQFCFFFTLATIPAQQNEQQVHHSQPSDKIWCRFLIPSKVAGAIIGRGGATIRALREEVKKMN